MVIAFTYAVFGKCFIRVQRGALAHVDERGVGRAVRVQMRWIKLLKHGGNDAVRTLLVRVDRDLVVAVLRIVQVEIGLHFLTHLRKGCVAYM